MPLNDPVGYAWLMDRYALPAVPLPYRSYISGSPVLREDNGVQRRGWQSTAWPGDGFGDHIEFALKHEGLNLPLLWHLFRRIEPSALAEFIAAKPTGKYTRKAGFLYEWLTGRPVPLKTQLSGNYEPILDEDRYLCAAKRPDTRWRVHNNLPGTSAFCPLIEKKPDLVCQFDWNPAGALQELRAHYDASLFARATAWLYLMETRSTNEIESETPSPKRAERFVQALKNAGRRSLAETLNLDALTDLQATLVDPKGRIPLGLRSIQNYVEGEPAYGPPTVAYPCPPPALARELLDALAATGAACDGLHPVVRAAVLSFGFVFIHPFEDGNGRISRYLIHDSYVRDGLTPEGFIFPVSAVIVKKLREYSQALDRHSRAVLELADYDFDPLTRLMRLHNAEELEPLYRYPDLTAQTEYLFQVTRECADVALVGELDQLDRMERAKIRLRETLDLPDRRLNLLLAVIHQNGGHLSANKRSGEFFDLDDAEVAEAERCYGAAFAESSP